MAETYEPIYQICFRRQYLVSKNQDEIDEQFGIIQYILKEICIQIKRYCKIHEKTTRFLYDLEEKFINRILDQYISRLSEITNNFIKFSEVNKDLSITKYFQLLFKKMEKQNQFKSIIIEIKRSMQKKYLEMMSKGHTVDTKCALCQEYVDIASENLLYFSYCGHSYH